MYFIKVIKISNVFIGEKIMNYKVRKFEISYVKEKDTLHKAIAEKRIITSKHDVNTFVKNYLSDLPYEKCCVIALDNKSAIIGFTSFQGTVNQAAVYPREVFGFLFSAGATSFILTHNHPGGNRSPSVADWNLTQKLKTAGENLDIQLLDHIIVTEDSLISLRELAQWHG